MLINVGLVGFDLNIAMFNKKNKPVIFPFLKQNVNICQE